MHALTSKWLLRWQWNDMKESMHSWLSELNKSMNQWISESTNQRINEAINQNESLTSESVNQWINETMNNQRIKAPMNPWINEWRNEWNERWVDGWIGGWMMDEWATFSSLSCSSSLSSPFAEAPLLPLLLLLWAATYLGYFCFELHPSVGSATGFFASRSWYNPFSNLVALRSRTAAVAMRIATTSCNPACQERRSITHALLRAAVPVRFVTAGCRPA